MRSALIVLACLALACLGIYYLAMRKYAEIAGPFQGKIDMDSSVVNYCQRSNELNTLIRDGLVTYINARDELTALIPLIEKQYYRNGGRDYTKADWVFPVEGYTASAIGGRNGNGYSHESYNYFHGNAHQSHPAQDIFIFDNNQDARDDRTKKRVAILAVTGGIVVAYETKWDTLSDLRGGKYLWIFEPANGNLLYYAHNDSLLVQPGDIVKPGDKIAFMGRSGLNAWKRRSPTHLHISMLHIENGFPRPLNIYQDLLKSKTL